MGIVRFNLAVSLDGYSAGPNQTLETPLGEGGESLHDWMIKLRSWRESHGYEGGEESPSSAIVDEWTTNVGAYVMGRNMFGGGPGPWNEDEPWRGWWGDEPPYHAPVFVLTHHAREPLPMEGGTTFHFVTDGIDAAMEQAKAAAGEKDVVIAGGADVIQQAFRAGYVDEFEIDVSPLLLGGGTRLIEDIGDQRLEQIRVVEAPGVTHLKYRVLK
jgi:dihydrofolate reductase